MSLEKYITDPALTKDLVKYANNIREYHKHRLTVQDTTLNCSLGKSYPVENAMVPISVCNGICVPGGQRSRIEWCGKCNKIE